MFWQSFDNPEKGDILTVGTSEFKQSYKEDTAFVLDLKGSDFNTYEIITSFPNPVSKNI